MHFFLECSFVRSYFLLDNNNKIVPENNPSMLMLSFHCERVSHTVGACIDAFDNKKPRYY